MGLRTKRTVTRKLRKDIKIKQKKVRGTEKTKQQAMAGGAKGGKKPGK